MTKKNKITKKHIVIKTIFQISLYLFEIISIAGICTWISTLICPIETDMFINSLERFALFYGFYQMIIFAVFNNINDIVADEYLALYNSCELALLACKTNDINRKNILIYGIDKKLLASNTFNDIEVRDNYNHLITYIKNSDITAIEYLKVTSFHCYESSKLQWRYSILLRLLK